MTIALRGRGPGLDQAPVDVGFAVERRRGVLAVPVKALLARQGGGYAVEVADRRLVASSPGCSPTTASRSPGRCAPASGW